MFVEKEFLITSIVKILNSLDTNMLEAVYTSLNNISGRSKSDGLQERNQKFVKKHQR